MRQKAYVTNPPNISLFDTAKETNVKLMGNLRYLESQYSHSFTNHSGLAINALVGFQGQYGADAGWVFYKSKKDRMYFETVAGYGYFNAHSIIDNPRGSLFLLPGGDFYCQNIESKYHKLFIQPSFFFGDSQNMYGITLRYTWSLFTDYRCKYYLKPYSAEYNSPPTEYVTALFTNKFGYTVEPVITYRKKINRRYLYFQFGICFSGSSISHDTLSNKPYQSPKPYSYYSYSTDFPLHAVFNINCGMEFGLKKKNRSDRH